MLDKDEQIKALTTSNKEEVAGVTEDSKVEEEVEQRMQTDRVRRGLQQPKVEDNRR